MIVILKHCQILKVTHINFEKQNGNLYKVKYKSLSCARICDPMDCPWNSLGKNTEVGCHFLLQTLKFSN